MDEALHVLKKQDGFEVEIWKECKILFLKLELPSQLSSSSEKVFLDQTKADNPSIFIINLLYFANSSVVSIFNIETLLYNHYSYICCLNKIIFPKIYPDFNYYKSILSKLNFWVKHGEGKSSKERSKSDNEDSSCFLTKIHLQHTREKWTKETSLVFDGCWKIIIKLVPRSMLRTRQATMYDLYFLQ